MAAPDTAFFTALTLGSGCQGGQADHGAHDAREQTGAGQPGELGRGHLQHPSRRGVRPDGGDPERGLGKHLDRTTQTGGRREPSELSAELLLQRLVGVLCAANQREMNVLGQVTHQHVGHVCVLLAHQRDVKDAP